ncbi:cupin domain-containing protein [Jiangella rhizosphaerae]|uniref:Cupin domain-containing protein n=1 Tax=Jiangella rhizosphaerae TaxID=2293569 RepID=A0A418KJ85_9ACTN|nr:cupin domain-containing protein [Jiangella rhizosphaerae]RIQ14431.1 cupin domain-containing protein [Jiangella rhizosphaerae]
MTQATPSVRSFGTAMSDRTIQVGHRQIFVTPAVEKTDGGPLSAYSARFGRGEVADLPAPYEEVWVVLRGALRIRGGSGEVVVGAGDFVQVPEQSPGTVEAIEDTVLVCVSVPAH